MTTPRYCHGNRNTRNIYRIDPEGTEEHVAVVLDPDEAGYFVRALNSHDDAMRIYKGQPEPDPSTRWRDLEGDLWEHHMQGAPGWRVVGVQSLWMRWEDIGSHCFPMTLEFVVVAR